MMSSQIHPERLKRFVRHVCVITKKYKDREKSRIDLQKQMEKLKRFSTKKKEMDQELKELNQKVSLVLEKEMNLLGLERGEKATSREMMRGVMENRERIKGISDSIDDIKEKLENYILLKTKRQREIDKLETKIRGNAKKKDSTALLKNRLKKLEAFYKQLKSKGVDVSRVERRIDDLRLRLAI